MYIVPNMAVLCRSLLLCCPVILFKYFLNDLDMVSLPLLLLLSLLFLHSTFYFSSYFKFLYFKILLAYLLNIFVSPNIAESINRPVPSLLSRIAISDLFLGIVLSVFSRRFYDLLT